LKKKLNNIGQKIIMIILCFSLFVINLSAKEIPDKHKTELSLEQIEIINNENIDDKKLPQLKTVKIDYNKLISLSYQPIFNKGLLVSNGSNERTLVRVKIEVPDIPVAVLGVNENEKYVEYIPFNYDYLSKQLLVTAENNSVIIPLVENVSRLNLETKQIVDNDVNFNILSNHNGMVKISIDSLYSSNDNIYYKVYSDNGIILDKTYLNDSIFYVKVFQRGVYRFEIYKKNNILYDTKLWEQEVYVEPNALNETTKNKLNTLAREYAPILTMSEKECYKPLKLTDIFSNSSYKIALNTKSGTKKFALPSLKNYMRYNGYSKALFEGHWGIGTNSDSLKLMPISTYTPAVYYSYVSTKSNYIINYHFIYNYDSKTENNESSAHNFDREQISIIFNKLTMEPEYIYYPQHLLGSKMGMRTDSGSAINNIRRNSNVSLESKWVGYVKVPFTTANTNNMVFNNTHIIIAIAEGSHAPYPLSGNYSFSGCSEPAGINTTIDSSCFFIPSDIYHNKPNNSQFNLSNKYDLYLLDINEIISGSDQPTSTNLLAFSGYWVDIVGLNNVKFPPFIKIMRNTDGYIEESIKSDGYTFEINNIPESIIKTTKDINDFLNSNL